jgi:hypothetical protein
MKNTSSGLIVTPGNKLVALRINPPKTSIIGHASTDPVCYHNQCKYDQNQTYVLYELVLHTRFEVRRLMFTQKLNDALNQRSNIKLQTSISPSFFENILYRMSS